MANKIKFYKNINTISAPTVADDGVYFVKSNGSSEFDMEIINNGMKSYLNRHYQTLSVDDSEGGLINISNTNQIKLYSLGFSPITRTTENYDFTDREGLTLYKNNAISGTTAYPISNTPGVGLNVIANNGSNLGRFEIWTSQTSNSRLYYRMGINEDTAGSWYTFASEAWVSSFGLTRANSTSTANLNSVANTGFYGTRSTTTVTTSSIPSDVTGTLHAMIYTALSGSTTGLAIFHDYDSDSLYTRKRIGSSTPDASFTPWRKIAHQDWVTTEINRTAHTHDNIHFLSNIDQYLSTTSTPSFSGLTITKGTIKLNDPSITINDSNNNAMIRFTNTGSNVISSTNGYIYLRPSGTTGTTGEIVISTAGIIANKFITKNGTLSHFVKGDGSLDSNTYVTEAQVDNQLNSTDRYLGNRQYISAWKTLQGGTVQKSSNSIGCVNINCGSIDQHRQFAIIVRLTTGNGVYGYMEYHFGGTITNGNTLTIVGDNKIVNIGTPNIRLNFGTPFLKADKITLTVPILPYDSNTTVSAQVEFFSTLRPITETKFVEFVTDIREDLVSTATTQQFNNYSKLTINDGGSVNNTNFLVTGIAKVDRLITSRMGYSGDYNVAETQGVWGIGKDFNVTTSKTTLGNLYGLGYSYINVGGTSYSSRHQIHFANAGIVNVSINMTDGFIRAKKFEILGGSSTDILMADGSLKSLTTVTDHNHTSLVGENANTQTDANNLSSAIQNNLEMKWFGAIPKNTTNLFPNTSNANGVLHLGNFSNTYWHQLGFSSNHNVYHRSQNSVWKRLLTESDIPNIRLVLSGGVTSNTITVGNNSITEIPIHTVRDAYVTWGGKNMSGGFSGIDAVLNDELRPNRFAFMPADVIKFEHSNDSGTTFTEFVSYDSVKTGLFSGIRQGSIGISPTSLAGKVHEVNRLRITLSKGSTYLYTQLSKFIINISTDGSSECWVRIEARTTANVTANNDTWVTIVEKQSISGWSGSNVVNITPITFGNGDSQYNEIRFIFGCDSTYTTNIYQGLRIFNIYGYGGVGWKTPSSMARTGNLYNYDYEQNMLLPNGTHTKNIILNDATTEGGTIQNNNGAVGIRLNSAGATIISSNNNNYIILRPNGTNSSVGETTIKPDGSVNATSFKRINGLSTQFLKADGSVDTTTYLPTSFVSGRSSALDTTNVGFGHYYMQTSDTSKPSGVVDGAFLHIGYDNKWSGQLLFDWRNNDLYVRSNNFGTFSSFDKLLKSSDLNLSNYVTLDSTQTISGQKTFSNFRLSLETVTAENWSTVDYSNSFGNIYLKDVYNIPVATTKMSQTYGTILGINGRNTHDKTQLIFNGNNGVIQYRKSWYNNSDWSDIRTILDSSNHATYTRASLITSTSATGVSNIATTNTNTFLNIVQGGSSVGSSSQITGSGSVTVTSDTTGKITITGTNTTYSVGTKALLTTGTDTTSRVWTAKDIHDYVTELPIALVSSTTATGVTNVATTNNNTFLNIVKDGQSLGSSTQISGAGSVTVTSDTTGKITITGADVDTLYVAGSGLTLTGNSFSLPVTITGTGDFIKSVTQTTNGITVTKTVGPKSISDEVSIISSNIVSNLVTLTTTKIVYNESAMIFLNGIKIPKSKISFTNNKTITINNTTLTTPIIIGDFIEIEYLSIDY